MDKNSDSSYNYFKKVRGSDPRVATCRGKLQYRRSKLNQEINKQMMIRNGAERLFKATTNKKLRETVALELSFVNSNLQLLKEQLAELNSSVQIYQNKSTQLVPMIPLGLKETKEIDFKETFKDFILEHYSEDAEKYEKPVQEFMDIRQAIRTPTRDQNGVKLLFEYYSLLYFVDRRFFPPHRSMGIFFEWFDSLTGVPSTQKTIAFEKASVLFNIAALYTQIAAKQDRTTNSGADASVDNFLRAAGMFKYIKENFSNAPSMDLSPSTLEMLIHLMLAQARECLFEKLMSGVEKLGLDCCLEVAQEAAEVAEVYLQVHKVMSAPPVKDYVPYSWISLVLVKSEHYRAVAHHYVAVGLLDHIGDINETTARYLEYVHAPDPSNATCIDIRVPKSSEERRQLGKAHLREALLLHEESLRLHRMCRQLRQVDTLQERLRTSHDSSLNRYADVEEEDNFQEILDPPQIQAATKYQLALTAPDLSLYKVKDLFHDLGPLSIFSARHHWTAARVCTLQKSDVQSYGFSVRGDSPVIIAGIDSGSIAEAATMKEGDFIVAIGDKDAKWMTHDEVVSLIKESGSSLTLKVITPMDRNYLNPKSSASSSPMSTTSSISGLSSGACYFNMPIGSLSSSKSKDRSRRMTWNFFRRSQSRERELSPLSNCNENVLLR